MELNIEKRVDWIRERVKLANAKGVVIGESGGKDSATVTALCVKALGSKNVLGVTMPCNSNKKDIEHAELVAKTFGIELLNINLDNSFDLLREEISLNLDLSNLSISNIKPRLRMTTLYAIVQTKNYLVVGTDNLSEITMGYFTKWGDGGYDFNPLADLTMEEVLELGKILNVPHCILEKSPSAGLWEDQTDEMEMGVTYKSIQEFIKIGTTDEISLDIIKKTNKKTQHKREMPYLYK